jgi:uncharacterized protein (UPF0332 family)
MNPRRFIELAREMVTRSHGGPGTATEAEKRSAISRAYYGAFHVAVECLASLGIEATQSSHSHVVVRNGLNNCGDPDIELVGADLTTLYTNRLRADYRLGDRTISANADQMTTLAEKVVAELDNHQRSWRADASKREALATAILAWAKSAGQPLFPKK